MTYRPLAIVSGLTFGDYLLWNWSLNNNHDVLALASGLTLPPLALACLAMLALNVVRLLGRSTMRSRRRAALVGARARREDRVRAEDERRPATVAGGNREASSASTASSPSSSGKLAA